MRKAVVWVLAALVLLAGALLSGGVYETTAASNSSMNTDSLLDFQMSGGGLGPIYVTNRFTGRTWKIHGVLRRPVVPAPPPPRD